MSLYWLFSTILPLPCISLVVRPTMELYVLLGLNKSKSKSKSKMLHYYPLSLFLRPIENAAWILTIAFGGISFYEKKLKINEIKYFC